MCKGSSVRLLSERAGTGPAPSSLIDEDAAPKAQGGKERVGWNRSSSSKVAGR